MTSHVEPVAAFPADAHERRLRFMTWFVRVAGIYNASAVVVLVTPGALDLVGVGVGEPTPRSGRGCQG